MGSDVFAADYKTTPYWQDIAPKVSLPEQELPDEIDVLIIGAGYTGWIAALQTASVG